MLDPATDVDLVAGASVSVANFSGCQYFSCQSLWLPVPQLPVSLAASTSVASVSAAGNFSYQCLCLSCWYLCISCQCLGCLYLNWCPRSVPWLPRISLSQLLKTVVRRLSRIPMSHQQRCPVSRPSSPQTTTDQVICNSKNVMNI